MQYFAFIASAYALSGLALLGLGLWIFFDAKARRGELEALAARGVRRRSARTSGGA